MTAIPPPPVGADADETVQTDNRKALALLQKDSAFPKRGSLVALIGSALALGLVGAAFATLGARRSRPWYVRLVSF